MPVLLAPLVTVGLTALIGEVAATGAILGIEGLTVAGLVTGAVTLGLAVGAESLLSHKKSPNSGFQPQLSQPGTVGAQSIGPRFHANGQLRVGGVYFYRWVDSGLLLYAIVVNCGKLDSLIAVLVDEEQQITAGTDYPPYYVAADNKITAPTQGRKFASTLRYTWNSGLTQVPGPPIAVTTYEFVNATDAGFVSRILKHRIGGGIGDGLSGAWSPTSGDPFWWDDTKLARGLACFYSEAIGQNGAGFSLAAFLSVYPNRYPQMSFIVRGEPVYDPRDPAQSFSDPTTWKYSRSGVPDPGRNNALIWAYYWTHAEGGRLTYDDIHWPSVIQAADDCDRQVRAYGGGTEVFARCDLQWNTSQPHTDVENRILAGCDGMVYEIDGKQAIWIVQDITPAVTLTAADISSIEWDATPGALEEANYIQASYVEPRAQYANIATTPVTDDASIAAVGETPATIQLDAVTNFNQAYRLAHRVLRRRNPPQIVKITGGPRLLRAAGEFMVTITAPEYGVNGRFLVSDLAALDPSLASVSMTFKEVASDAFDDVVSPDDPVAPALADGAGAGFVSMLAPIDIPRAVTWDGTPTPYLTAEAWTWQILNGGAPVIGTTTIGVPTDTTLEFNVQSRPVDPGTHLPLGDGTWSPATDGAVTWSNYIDQWNMESPAVLASHSYEIRAWFRSAVTGQISIILAGKFVDVPAHP